MKTVIACVAGVLLSCGVAGQAQAQSRTERNFRDRDSRPLATRPAYPLGRADDVRRPGFNGKEWRGESIVGGRDRWPAGWRDPGPAAYGAIGRENALVFARVGQVMVAFSPWESTDNARLEYARQAWLAENGYVGGVRTFVNDTLNRSEALASAEPAAKKHEIVPRAIITVPIDIPRFKGRQEVKADEKATPACATKIDAKAEAKLADVKAGEKLKISWPSGAPKDAIARTEKPTDVKIAKKQGDAKAEEKSVASAEK